MPPAPTPRSNADKRAHALLQSVIGEEAYQQYRQDGYIDVVGSDGRHYRIMANSITSNVWEIDPANQLYSGRPRIFKTWCAHLPWQKRYSYSDAKYPPLADHHLAQVLMLLTDAPKFRRIAF
jgi:hypothetical protein